MVDSLGIMLMSPLAILAAWLSGRTLAGLMTQDSSTTPWPMASTFVLACMTLVSKASLSFPFLAGLRITIASVPMTSLRVSQQDSISQPSKISIGLRSQVDILYLPRAQFNNSYS
jgi:hypothetical protein